MKKQQVVGAASFAAFVGTIFLANWLIENVEPVQVWPGIYAPAAVYAAGFAFTLRDLVHAALGRWVALAAIALGALLSAFVSPQVALASGTAFAVSELLDLGVFEGLRQRGWTAAVLVSGAVGLVVDSLIFLQMAFGNLDFLPGQLIGKSYALLISIPLSLMVKRAVLPQRIGATS